MEERSVLVTGSSRGIGLAIARELAGAGYVLVLHSRANPESTETLAQDIRAKGGQARVLQFDVANRLETTQAIENDMESNGAYYGVVCNAGVAKDTAFPAMTSDEWDSVLRTNLDGFYNVLHPVIMPMIRRRKPGRIVTLSSVSGIMGNRGQVNYSASKAGIIGATKSLAIELAKREITVNCVAPGLIETDMIEDAPLDKIVTEIPMRRVGKPEEVAKLIGFLMSDAAAYITRQVISVNGGLC